MNELRYTLKLIIKNIRYSALCISVIALGIGIILAFYTLIGNFSDADLPLEQSDRYITFKKRFTDPSQPGRISLYDNVHYQYFKDNATSFQNLLAWRELPVSISDGQYSESFRGAHVEPGLIQMTRVQPLLGRVFRSEDAYSDSGAVAILSYASWQTYYAGRGDIIGHSSRINGETRTIIGVMPEEFNFPIVHDIWVPLALPENSLQGQGDENLYIVGILADEVNLQEASSEVGLLQSQIKSTWSQEYAHIDTSEVVRYSAILGGEVAGDTILVMVFLLLVIFNAGNLFVIRGEERIQELAIRSAMGADHRRIAQALLLESFIVCFLGLLFGLGFAQFCISYIDGATTNFAPLYANTFWYDMSLTPEIIAQSAIVTCLVWLISGGLPAWKIGRSNINELINQSGKGLSDAGASRTNKILVNGQLIISCLLLTVGVSSIISFSDTEITVLEKSQNLYAGTIQFDNENPLNEVEAQQYRNDLEMALLNQPAVESVFFASNFPGNGGTLTSYDIEERSLLSNDIYPQQYVTSVSDDYFDVLGIAISQGREFGAEDSSSTLPVAIVDSRTAESLWPEGEAIGKLIRVNPESESSWITVVGVSENQTQEGFLDESKAGTPVLYLPISQSSPNQFFVIFEASEPALDYQQTLRTTGTQANRDIPINSIQSMTQFEELRYANREFNVNINFTFLLIAIYLTIITTYGLAARATSRRQIEMGVRMALGAGRANCLAVILKDGIFMVITGITIGGVMAVLGTYALLASIQSDGFALDTLISTTLSIAFLMGSLVLLANYIPARKIVAMEPGEALHYE